MVGRFSSLYLFLLCNALISLHKVALSDTWNLAMFKMSQFKTSYSNNILTNLYEDIGNHRGTMAITFLDNWL